MKKIKDFFGNINMQRRSFLKLAGLSSLGLGLTPLSAKWGNAGQPKVYKPLADWKTDENGNSYFIPRNIRTDNVNDQGTVTAKVDGLWRKYPVREFDDDFHEWWISEKTWYYDQLIAFFEGETDELEISSGGHHHPMLCTYGRKYGSRGDSDFHLNTAVKGLTIIPKEEHIQYINDEVEKVYEAVRQGTAKIPVDIFKLRQELYQDKTLWDKTRFATLELYSGRPINKEDDGGGYGFTETKTFQNLMVNPMATMGYLGLHASTNDSPFFGGQEGLYPHFQFRGFCWLISYYNPANTEYELAIADYINQAHCGYHGGACDIATNIFLIVEQFNETPSYDPGRGKRTVPSHDYENSSKPVLAIKPRQKKKLTTAEKLDLIKKMGIPV